MEVEREYHKVINGRLCYMLNGVYKAYSNETLGLMFTYGDIDLDINGNVFLTKQGANNGN